MEKNNLLKLPTPLHEIKVNNQNKYYIKRDDMTDFVLGGNKARKIEFFLAEAKSHSCDYIVTYGSTQSNHCRVVCAAAARMGLKCLLILSGSKDELKSRGNDIIYLLSGADIVWCTTEEVRITINNQIEKLKRHGYNPYFIQGGGHGNCGTHAYIETYKEIRKQSENIGVEFDYIFLASGTGTTQAGLLAGKNILKGNEKIVGISIARKKKRGKEVIKKSLEDYYTEFYKRELVYNDDIIFDDSYIGKGYGDFNIQIVEYIKLMLKENSILIDPTYTGKALYGMCDYLNKKNIKNKNILFIHTGGTPIFFSRGEEILDLL